MKYFTVRLYAVIFLALLSCGGGPKPPDAAPPTEETVAKPQSSDADTPGKDALDALNSARDRAENARKKAINVQGQVYFPDEWKAAESKNDAGKNAKKDTLEDVNAAIALYNAAAEAYEAIADKSGPLLAKDQEDALKDLQDAMTRAEKSRKDAQDAQGPVYFPQDWQTAETDHQTGKDAKKDTLEEIKSATALYTKAADEYDDIAGKSRPLMAKEKDDALAALNAAIARMEKSRKDAQDNQGPVYFPNDWKSAEAQNKAGKDAKKTTTEEIKTATALYTQAADSYDDIANKSRPLFAKEKNDALAALNAAMARAEKSRKDAQDVQGPAYFPKDWQTAETKHKAGQDAKKDSAAEVKAATALYTQAADAYDAIANKSRAVIAKEKDDALKALNEAMARAEQSRKQAMDVDGQVYFPNDWKNAESKNQAGKNAKKTTPDEIKSAAALYTQAADEYDDIAGRSRPLYAKDREDADKALQAAMARAEKSRKDAQDVEGPANFPKEWQAAETKHQNGKDAKKTTSAEVKAATALYTQAADGYDDIVRKNTARLAKDDDDARKALDAAIARAERSRNTALENQGPAYFPNDWKNAEAQNQAGKNAKKTTTEEIKAAAALYTQAADSYDDIAGRSRGLLAKDKDDAQKALQAAIARAEKSRKDAQDVEAPANFPKEWQTAETKHQTGKDAKKTTTEEIKAAAVLYTQAADAYDDITNRTRAQAAKDKDDAQKALQAAIARAEKSRKDAQDVEAPANFPKEWQTAETKHQAGKDAKKDALEEIKAATALYTQAADEYDDVAGRSRSLLAKDKDDAQKALQAAMARAEQSRKNAQDVQAPVYFPKDWQTAETQNQAGKNAKKTTTEEIRAATALYTQAADTYDDITNKSRPLFAKDRDDAEKALQAAMARAEQSRKNAQDAQAPVYFPKDWQTAETQNQAGKDAKKTTAEEIRAATALYIQAADTYDDIAGRSRAAFAQQEQEDARKALQAAMARAEQSRKQALGFQGQSYFPRDWTAAEARIQSGEGAKKDTVEELKAAAALYTQGADAYDDITRRSRPRYIQAWENALSRERSGAVEAGIDRIAPDHLKAADRLAVETRQNLNSAGYIPEEDTVYRPVDMYRALTPRAEGYKVRQEIIDRGFADTDPIALASGDADTSAAIQDYEAGNPKSSWDRANDALERYNAALLNGWMALAQGKMLDAGKERQAAVDVKAPAAVRDDFNRADGIYQQAQADFNAGKYESAVDLYSQAAARFIAAAKSAEDKRRRAEETITAAKQKTAESTALATSAGLMMEGTNE